MNQDTLRLTLQRCYVSLSNFSVPGAPAIFKGDGIAHMHSDVGINTQSRQIEPGFFEVSLTGAITSTSAGRPVAFYELVQCGIFQVSGTGTDMELQALLNVEGAAQVFPFFLESLKALQERATLPVLVIPDADFAALYRATQPSSTAPTTGPGPGDVSPPPGLLH